MCDEPTQGLKSGTKIMPDLFHMRTLPDLLAYHAQVRPDAIALQFEGHSTTYASFHREVYCLAASLNRLVVDADRRIAYLGKNSARYFELVFAAAQAGLVVVPLNWRLTEDEWSFILRDANATHLFVDAAFEEQGQQLGARIGLRAVHFIEQETTWQALVGPNDSASALKRVHADDVVVQIYTSGTTGTPKGAMLSHTNLLALREPGLRAGFSWFPRDGVRVWW